MNFENIKVDDVVFVETQVKYEFNSYESFFMPTKVIRVTKTQFIVENGDKYNKDGKKIGTFGQRAYVEGDKKGDKIIKDETFEYKYFKLKIVNEQKLNKLSEKIKCPMNSKLTLSELRDLNSKLQDVLDYIEKTHK